MTSDQSDLTPERSLRPGILLTAGRAAAFAVTFATPLVLARVFSQAEFGTYKQIVLMYATVAAIAQLGMADSLLYFLPSVPRGGGRYVLHALLVLAGSGLVWLALFVLGRAALAQWFGNAALSGLSGLLGVYVALTLPATLLEIVLTARRRYAAAGLAYGASDAMRAAAMVVPALITRSLAWVLAGAAAFGAMRFGATLLYLIRTFRGDLTLDRTGLRGQLGYALPLQLGVALWILVQNLHYYIVAARVGAAAFAIYAVGTLQIPIVDILYTPARNLLTVGMRGAMASNRPDAARALWHDTTARLALVFFPLTGVLVATARDLIPLLFTDRYAASVPIFMVWSTIALILAVQADGVLAAHGDTRAIAVVHGAQLLLMAALVSLLMRPLGLIGAVAGTTLAIAVGKILVLVRAAHLMHARLPDLLPWRRLGEILAAATAAMLGASVIGRYVTAAPAARVLLVSVTFTAVYVGMLAGSHARAAALRLLKEIAAWGFVLSGIVRTAARLNRRKSLVLLYHGVHGGDLDAVRNYDALHVRAERFERQMRHVAAHYRVVPLDRLLEPHGGRGAKPLAAITFDDGYGNLFDHAYPVLARLGLPATVFVTTGFLREQQTPWWDRAAAMVAASWEPEVRARIGGAEQRFTLCTGAQKRTALRALGRELLALQPERREIMLSGLADVLGAGEPRPQTLRPLSVTQLREMAGCGIAVGSHGCSHDSFRHLDRDRLAAEIRESKSVLESVTGRPVRWLAYPHGAFTPEAVEVAKAAGYRGAVTAIEEGLNDGIPDPFQIRRIGVADDVSFARFLVAVSGLRDALKTLLRKGDQDDARTPLDRRAGVPRAGVALQARPVEEARPSD